LNVIYVLAFDREAAAQSLSTQFAGLGARYLEKIIQVQFDLPHSRRDSLQRMFSERLQRLLAGVPRDLLDERRLDRLYHDAISPLLTMLREVVRLLNAVSVTLPAIEREVNPVDFLGVEVLRLYLPKVYEVLRREALHFVGAYRAMAKSTE